MPKSRFELKDCRVEESRTVQVFWEDVDRRLNQLRKAQEMVIEDPEILRGTPVIKGCSHVNYLGKVGQKDWQLKQAIIDGDWTFVTNNSVDFRGPANKPGSMGEYADVRLHAGLVCINAPFGLNLDLQRQIFDLILDDSEENGDLTNQVLEVDL